MRKLTVAFIAMATAVGVHADVTHKPMDGLRDNLEWAKEQSLLNDSPTTIPKADRADQPIALGLTEVGLPGITVDVLALLDDAATWEAPVKKSHIVEVIRHCDGDMYADATGGISDAPQVQAYDDTEELGFWGRRVAWMKDNPILTGATAVGAGAGVYYIGEKQGWWGSEGRNDSPGDDSLTSSGITLTIGDNNVGNSIIIQAPQGASGASGTSNSGTQTLP